MPMKTPLLPVTAALALAATPLAASDPAAVKPIDSDMHHFMEYGYEPAYLRLKEVLARNPADKAAWKPVKGDALTLAELTNLLVTRAPDAKAAKDWTKHAFAVRTEGENLYQAARKQDLTAAKKAWGAMIQNCNACHKQFADGEHQLKP